MRWSDYRDTEQDDDFYDIDGDRGDATRYQRSSPVTKLVERSADDLGTTIYSQEEFDEAYERSKQRTPQSRQ